MYRGKGFLEVRQFGVNKGTVVTLILSYLKDKVGVPDFAFFAGDDGSDELAFKGEVSCHPVCVVHIGTVDW